MPETYSEQTQIQQRYEQQREDRNALKRAEMLSPDFPGMNIDEMLAKLEFEPGCKDWRHCLTFWARPPTALKALIHEIQQKLVAVVPNLWIMEPSRLHMTTMEVAHSLSEEEMEAIVRTIAPNVAQIADFTFEHRARLVRPLVNYDSQGLALQFVPAAGLDDDRYTYLHLRRDVWDQVQAAGVTVGSRYIAPSAHLTIARFITTKDFETGEGKVDHDKVRRLVETIDGINEWLQREYWPTENGSQDGGEWVVGTEKGQEFRKGTLWYGGGESVHIGKGF